MCERVCVCVCVKNIVILGSDPIRNTSHVVVFYVIVFPTPRILDVKRHARMYFCCRLTQSGINNCTKPAAYHSIISLLSLYILVCVWGKGCMSVCVCVFEFPYIVCGVG